MTTHISQIFKHINITHLANNNQNQHIPTTMINIDCKKKCRNARYCPLELSLTTIVHYFQGFGAGFGVNVNINYNIADINTLHWEKKHPKTSYVVASKAKTIGQMTDDEQYPTKLNLLLTVTIGMHRFTHCHYRENREKCLTVLQHKQWIQHLNKQFDKTKTQQ